MSVSAYGEWETNKAEEMIIIKIVRIKKTISKCLLYFMVENFF